MKALKLSKKVNKFYKDLNIEIILGSSEKEKLTNEVKRSGFLIDRGQTIELRPGDIVTMYVSMGGFEK
jgi:hypothetical protein